MNEVHYIIDQNEKGFFFNLVAANGEKLAEALTSITIQEQPANAA